jgi:hypothetical protein
MVPALLLAFAIHMAIPLGVSAILPGAGRSTGVSQTASALEKRLARATKGLVYMSETDAPVEPVVWTDVERLEPTVVVARSGLTEGIQVDVVDVETFFAPLVEEQDWYGEEELRTARRFARLKRLLDRETDDLRVFRCGDREVDYLILGRTPDGHVAGVRTKAVET